MKLTTRQDDEAGFTLAELAVGMVLSALILVVAYAAYAGFHGVFGRWEARRTLEADVFLLERRFAEDMRESEEVRRVSERQMVIVTPSGPVVYEEQSGGRWTRNGIPVVRDSAAYASLSVAAVPLARLYGQVALGKDTVVVDVAATPRRTHESAWDAPLYLQGGGRPAH